MPQERLDKLVASAAGLSRSDARRAVLRGEVTVNRQVVRAGDCKCDPETDLIALRGKTLRYQKHLYLLMNKPLGVVSSTDDPDAETVLELLPPEFSRRGLFPAGRLDKYSEGMLVITDDGDFAHRMLSPKRHVPKTYYVEVDAPVVGGALAAAFAQGMELGGGESASPAVLEAISPTSARVTIREGLYHQVRRMFDRHGAKVTRLVRVQIGAMEMDRSLAPGECRELTGEERALLLTIDEPQRR